MKFNFLEILTASENEHYYKSQNHIRVAIIAGVLMYSAFGFLDVFMMPQTHKYGWIIRFIGIAFVSTTVYLFTYSSNFIKYARTALTFLVVVSQLGIVSMIYFSKPNEGAYWSYYVGLILVILWAALIFRLSIPEVVFTSITNILMYDVVAIGIQKIHLYPHNSIEFAYLINNNFFLVSTSLLAILGAYQINNYKKSLKAHNRLLKMEKAELFKAKKKAEESDKLKSAFLANVSHEIRTPMNAILGFSELLKDNTLTTDKREEYFDIIKSKGNQLLNLINDIIDLSKIESNTVSISPSPFQLNFLLDELLISYKRAITNQNRSGDLKLIFTKGLPDDKAWVKADANRLKQVFSNLLDNALKFTKKGEISVGYELIDNNFLEFRVQDTGIGIASDKQSVIFERFRQVCEDKSLLTHGTGLGLSIVKSLVELADGEIWVESEPNRGTTFYFTLPYNPALNGKHDETLAFTNTDDIDWNGKTVLLAEDDDDNYLFLEELLRETKVNVVRAKDGQETVKIALGSSKIDLILMDIKMPVMNGYEAAKQIKLIKNNIPIIAQTAYAMEEDRHKALASNCNDYISKPIEVNKLFFLMSKYLN
jgi:signal transduction histidine kinase